MASLVVFPKNWMVLEGRVKPRFWQSIYKKQALHISTICSVKTYF